ncbi:MAG: hypothetical protein LUQ20_02605 [Candidatus Methanoperedens sp.]|jgi:hypothetical protein|nr:hypothetical protein [Candidatus Methanoperedens sp.]
MEQTIKKTLLMLCVVSIIAAGLPVALAQTNESQNATNATPAVTTPVVTTPPVATPVPTEGKFRVGPSITLRPVTDVIETNQDGIVELFMNNPSLNEVTLNVDARISVPSGIHVYGESFAQAAGAGVAYGTFTVPPGTARTITVVVKADKSARIGSHTISFTGLYWPGENKDNYQPLSLTYSVTVKEPSKAPEIAPTGTEKPKTQIAGFGVVLAIFGIFAMARLMSRKI